MLCYHSTKKVKLYNRSLRLIARFVTSRIPHFVDNRFTDGGEAVSLTRRPPFTLIPGTHFC
jgi:hypothetical protein